MIFPEIIVQKTIFLLIATDHMTIFGGQQLFCLIPPKKIDFSQQNNWSGGGGGVCPGWHLPVQTNIVYILWAFGSGG